MSDRCYSTLVCAERDKDIFEKMGYGLEESQALTVDGDEIPGAVVMVDEESNNGHYDELTALTDIPFLVCNGSCAGAYGDHLIVSDGKEWRYSEALHESNYPAVRVELGGVIQTSEVDDARKYWTVYSTAVAAIKRTARQRTRPKMKDTNSTDQTHTGAPTK
jgi:hypothetical protein